MNLSRLSLGFTVVLICESPVLAETGPSSEKPDRAELEHAARKACMVGNFVKGVDILADLFIVTGNPVYIFNQGRCFQQNHQWQEAIDRFSEYLRKVKGTPEAEGAEAQSHIAECEEHLPKAVAAPPEPASPPIPPPALPPAPPAVSVVPVSSPPVPAPIEDRGFGLRVSGIIVGAVGLAGIGAGVFCSAQTYEVRDDAAKLDRYKTVGSAAYGVGAAGLATGIVLYVIGHGRKGAEKPSVAFLPAIGPQQAAMFLRGTF